MKFVVILSNIQSNEFKEKYKDYEQSYHSGCHYLIPQPYISTNTINGMSYVIDI
jgi:hypothetical protein